MWKGLIVKTDMVSVRLGIWREFPNNGADAAYLNITQKTAVDSSLAKQLLETLRGELTGVTQRGLSRRQGLRLSTLDQDLKLLQLTAWSQRDKPDIVPCFAAM